MSMMEARCRIWEGRSVQDSDVIFATARFVPSGNRYTEEGVWAGLWIRTEAGRK